MMETREPVITEALAVIDKALAEMLRRELVSAVEVGDLLLDLRSLLSASAATTECKLLGSSAGANCGKITSTLWYKLVLLTMETMNRRVCTRL